MMSSYSALSTGGIVTQWIEEDSWCNHMRHMHAAVCAYALEMNALGVLSDLLTIRMFGQKGYIQEAID